MYPARMSLTRIAANFTAASVAALNAAADREGRTRTDVLGRAVQLYQVYSEQTARGNQLVFLAHDGQMTVVRLL